LTVEHGCSKQEILDLREKYIDLEDGMTGSIVFERKPTANDVNKSGSSGPSVLLTIQVDTATNRDSLTKAKILGGC